MAKLRICTWPEEVLSEKTVEVTEITGELLSLLDDMAETMYAGDGIGLAGPQVGKSLRIAVVDIPGEEDLPGTGLMFLINPYVLSADGSIKIDEGCLSFPGIEVPVERNRHVTVEYMDREGQKQTIEAVDLAAICLQHEIDHLDGITMIDRVGPIRRKLALHDYRKANANK